MNLIVLSADASKVAYEVLFELGIIIVIGLALGRVFESIKLPDITGYLVAGLLLGPVFGVITHVDSLEIISSVALGFIAFEIGTELWLGKLRKTGNTIMIITIAQAFMTTFITSFLLSFVIDLEIAIILGAIAAATSPVDIMILTKKFRTKGPLTDTLLPVVGIDDALGILIFGVAIAIAKPIAIGGQLNIFTGIAVPLVEILVSCALGIILGLLIGFAIKTIDENNEKESKYLDVTVIGVLIAVSSSILLSNVIHLHISPILVPMVAGFVFTNMVDKQRYDCEERVIHSFTPPLMIAFFTIAGISLDLSVFLNTAMIVGIVTYIIGRTLGKVYGSYLGGIISCCPKTVKKYIGIALLPQAGVSIGLSIAASSILPKETGAKIQAIVLASIVVFELLGPILVTYALRQAGEIREDRFLKDGNC